MFVDNVVFGVEGVFVVYVVFDDVFVGDKVKVGLEVFVYVNDVCCKILEVVIIGDGCLGGEIIFCIVWLQGLMYVKFFCLVVVFRCQVVIDVVYLVVLFFW